LSAPPLAAPASLGRAAAVFAWHARTYRRAWRGTITVAFLNPIFFLLSLGFLLGGLVDRGGADLGGLTYLEFVAPGLLAATAMQIGTNEGSFPVMAGLRWIRTYHGIVATPVRVPELAAGMFAWAAARILVASVIFTVVAAAAGALTSPLAVVAPLAALLCGLAFTAPIAAVASGTDNHAVLTAIFRFGILPLFLFSGTFFPIEQLPAAIRPVAWATPLWHGVTLCRDLVHGTAALGPSLLHVVYLVAVIAGGYALTARLLRRSLLR
jgi:lipooligosaccharide transport system permease protein